MGSRVTDTYILLVVQWSHKFFRLVSQQIRPGRPKCILDNVAVQQHNLGERLVFGFLLFLWLGGVRCERVVCLVFYGRLRRRGVWDGNLGGW